MPITKQFGPSAVSYGDVVYRSGQNQERYKRSLELQNQGASATAAKADAQYKLGMLELEKDKWAKQWPLLEKEMDLREVESWLSKSVEYFKARSTAASARLNDRAMILDAAGVQIGQVPGSSSAEYSMSMQGGSGGGFSMGTQASGKGVKWVEPSGGFPGGFVPIPFTLADASRQYNMAFGNLDVDRWGRVSGQSKNIRNEMAKIDQTYQSEIARIDEVFGVSQGWTPRLFMTGAPESWQAPTATPAFGQNPFTGTNPRNDPGASNEPII